MAYNIFVDSDIVIDFYTNREPFVTFASKIFELNTRGIVKIYISALSINNIYYIVRKFLGHEKTLVIIEVLAENCEIVGTTKVEILQALRNNFSDFEDSIQYSSALTIQNLYAIVTRNVKDYKNSEIPVFSSQDFLKFIENKY